jgi:hypothetical protein
MLDVHFKGQNRDPGGHALGPGDAVRAPSGPEGLVARAVSQEQEERGNKSAASRMTIRINFM